METGVELQAFKQRDTSLTGEVFNLTTSGNAENDLLPALEQALRQRQHRLCCTGPPSITQQVQNRQRSHLLTRSDDLDVSRQDQTSILIHIFELGSLAQAFYHAVPGANLFPTVIDFLPWTGMRDTLAIVHRQILIPIHHPPIF